MGKKKERFIVQNNSYELCCSCYMDALLTPRSSQEYHLMLMPIFSEARDPYEIVGLECENCGAYFSIRKGGEKE